MIGGTIETASQAGNRKWGDKKGKIEKNSATFTFMYFLSINFLSCSIIAIRYFYYYQVLSLNGSSY